VRVTKFVSGLSLFLGLYVLISGSHKTIYANGQAVNALDSNNWRVYGGRATDDHYSDLSQINRTNVKKLAVAWTFDTGEKGWLETNPIVVDGVLYACTPNHSVFALSGATGKQIWKFDSGLKGVARSRGVSFWREGSESRIFAGFQNFLYALDAKTGKSIPDFGDHGRIDLRKGLRGEDYLSQSVQLTTPGTIYKDLIIVGGQNPETYPSPPGDIRAFDVRTGAVRWTFHTIPHPGEKGYETWPKDAWKTAGAANNWAGMAVDVERGIIYVPTGSPVYDFYGGDRLGDNLFSDSLLALDAATGKLIWHFQGVHHDIWDRDFPAAPVLLSIKRDGKTIDAVAQTTKSGYVYVFDRLDGTPLFPISNLQYPASDVPGEVASATQPLPIAPRPFARQSVTEETLTNRTPEMHAWAIKQFRTLIAGGQFVPPSVDKLTVYMPGMAGGAEWGGPAVDPQTGVMYVNSNESAWLVGLTVPPPPGSPGEKIYQQQCSICHGIDRAGSPPAMPALLGIEGIRTEKEIADVIHQGKGRMPPFNSLDDAQTGMLIEYIVRAGSPKRPTVESVKNPSPDIAHRVQTENAETKDDMHYKTLGFRRFLDPEGYPALSPPWGTLNAIDLNTGEYLWKIPFGEYPELVAKGMSHTGSDNYGGPVVTAGGLVFIGATVFDQKMHAYDSRTGKLLWETVLPFAGLATPATYMVNGKQYVVIASSGGQTSPKATGGLYIAFALSTSNQAALPPRTLHTTVNVHSGEEVFIKRCFQCHSVNEGQTRFGPSLYAEMKGSHPKQTSSQIRSLLKNGKGKMPPFNGLLTEEDAANLMAYLRTL
jgi:quinoprotein glucose dehydrogenase